MEITTPRADRAWCSTRINDDSSPTEGDKAELRRHSVFLGQNGNFDFWGDPNSGHVLSVGIPRLGTRSGELWGLAPFQARDKTARLAAHQGGPKLGSRVLKIKPFSG